MIRYNKDCILFKLVLIEVLIKITQTNMFKTCFSTKQKIHYKFFVSGNKKFPLSDAQKFHSQGQASAKTALTLRRWNPYIIIQTQRHHQAQSFRHSKARPLATPKSPSKFTIIWNFNDETSKRNRHPHQTLWVPNGREQNWRQHRLEQEMERFRRP